MSNIQPPNESLRKAVRWISGRLQENDHPSLMTLINEATFRFDLSPLDADFLIRFYKQKDDDSKSMS